MEIQHIATDLKGSGQFKEVNYSINMSAHAFSTLSTMYSNLYLAIVRELCCNAMDSHVVAGNAHIPFELYLPNGLSPTFKVRDFGTGLSEHAMETVYSSFFTSSKQNDNQQTGCFGLGSKTPYAYTQKFSAISYYNGMCYHYVNVIGDGGNPKLILMAANPTSEPNGLEVSFVVQPQHYSEFLRAAQSALRPFALRPVVKGKSDFKPHEYPGKEMFSGPGWSVRSRDQKDYYNMTSYAVMGNVEYPIGTEKQDLSVNALKVLTLPIVVDFPLGSFEMTPSRESIKWTDYSTRCINSRLETVYDELVFQLDKKFENAKTSWEASLIYYDLMVSTPIKEMGYKPLWNGAEITTIRDVITGIKATKFLACSTNDRSSSANRCSKSLVQHIKTEKEVDLYLADFPGATYRLANLVRDKFTRTDYCYLIDVADAPDDFVSPDGRSWRDTKLAEFCENMGFGLDKLKLASAIPKRERSIPQSRTVRHSMLKGSKARAFAYQPSIHGNSDEYWVEAEVDLTEPGFYVAIERWNPSGLGPDVTKAYELKGILSSAEYFKFLPKDTVLIGVKNSYIEKFEKQVAEAGSKMLPLGPYLREKIQKKWNEDQDLQQASYFFREYAMSGEREFAQNLKNFVEESVKSYGLSSESYLARLVSILDSKLMNRKDEVTQFHKCKSISSEVFACPQVDLGIRTRVEQRYPLLSEIKQLAYGWTFKSSLHKHLTEYVELMDEKLNKKVGA